MGLYYNKNAEWELIHSAYGTELKGKRGTWLSPFDGEQDVYTDISVNGRELYLGNHAILVTGNSSVINMEADKDLLCYMFAHREKEMDDYEFEQFWTKEYFGCLWRHHTRNRMLNERLENERKAEQEQREAKRQAQLDEFKAYAEKRKLYMIREYDTVYFIKLWGENKKAAGRVDDAHILDFAHNYPGNGCDIVETREVTA